jgi:hypothetical protein
MYQWHTFISVSALLLLTAHGCRHAEQDTGQTWTVVAEEQMTPEQRTQRDRALAAREAMFTSLKGRLMDVISSDGPGAAISVCSEEAPQIAERISREHGLAIGRTSFRLRNSDNTPPVWARQLVADRVAEPTFLAQEGKLAALLPIRTQAPCLMCHGSEDTIPASVKEALSQHYPTDRATGFAEGDLRGWFNVEVPSIDGSQDHL